MRVLTWYVHGGWMNAFTRIDHECVVPSESAPADATGVTRVPEDQLRDAQIDVVVLQRVEDIAETERLLGRRPGRDVPAVFVEHNTPKRSPVDEVHFLADQNEIPVVHVTHFNALVWDTGRAPTRVIEHGIPDPGALYTGEVASFAVVVNEPVRRARVVGTDLLPRFAECAPLDVYGIDVDRLRTASGTPGSVRARGDLPTDALHAELAMRRMYLHAFRWTSLGLSLLEAMSLGMPVIALAATEAPRAVPPEAGTISTDVDALIAAADLLLRDPERARVQGVAAREFAQSRYGMDRFRDSWNAMLVDAVERCASRHRVRGRRSPVRSLETPMKGRNR